MLYKRKSSHNTVIDAMMVKDSIRSIFTSPTGFRGWGWGGSGLGRGRGQGGGQGRGAGTKPGSGPGGNCVCPACGEKVVHQAGQRCLDITCPKCGTRMVRE